MHLCKTNKLLIIFEKDRCAIEQVNRNKFIYIYLFIYDYNLYILIFCRLYTVYKYLFIIILF